MTRESDPDDLAIAPFSAEHAKAFQEHWAGVLKVDRIITNSTGMKLVLIPPGEFKMGPPLSEVGRGDDEVEHVARITKPFFLGVCEVTQREYQAVMGNNPSSLSPGGSRKEAVRGMATDSFAVESVSWIDAAVFCLRLSALAAEKKAGRMYRLPTEAEWEYACRAGTTTPFHFGDKNNGVAANCNGQLPYGTDVKGPNLGRAAVVGTYVPNAFGVCDMHGNVNEWCMPRHWKGANCRGGGWVHDASYARAAFRYTSEPSLRYTDVGFRVALFASSQPSDATSASGVTQQDVKGVEDSGPEEDPYVLNAASWSIIAVRDTQALDFRCALRWAEAACKLEPGNGAFLNTLGVAQYRTGQFFEALATLNHSSRLNGRVPADVAFLAMTHHALGNAKEAKTLLLEMRNLANQPGWQHNTEIQSFLGEVEEELLELN